MDLQNAYRLSLMHKSLAEVCQLKETDIQGTQLLKLLLANCAHELRTPLNAIINYLEIVLDGSLISQEVRENISRSHSASKSLVYIINDLLDLINAENGEDLIKDEVFDLSQTIFEAAQIFGEEAKQKSVDLLVVQHSKLPSVLADQRRVRQVMMNLISNAVQHTSSGGVTVESSILPDQDEPDRHVVVEIAIHDTGSGMPQDTVETLFCQLEQVSNKEYIEDTRHKAETAEEAKSVLGLGLALVARIVRNMNGQLVVKSEVGTGSCFKMQLRFPLPADETWTAQETPDFPKVIPVTGTPPGDSFRVNMCERHIVDDENARDETNDFKSTISTDKNRFTLETLPCGGSKNLQDNYRRQWAHLDEITGNSSRTKPEAEIARQAQFRKTQPELPTDHPPLPEKSNYCVLVAEDDMINSRIVHKRLQKLGYTVYLTKDGKECASLFRKQPEMFDAILMDMQVRTLFCWKQAS